MAEYIFEINDTLFDEETGEMVMKPEFKGKIIRCEDCKHYKSYTIYGHKQGFCNRLGLQVMELDDFCSRAERREE